MLVAHQPTRGLDVGAIEYIGERLHAAASDGIGVLLVSTDLGEILALADRMIAAHPDQRIGRDVKAEIEKAIAASRRR